MRVEREFESGRATTAAAHSRLFVVLWRQPDDETVSRVSKLRFPKNAPSASESTAVALDVVVVGVAVVAAADVDDVVVAADADVIAPSSLQATNVGGAGFRPKPRLFAGDRLRQRQ